MSRESEAYMPPELVQRVLESAPPGVVLIGGQALAYWMGHYSISVSNNTAPAISRDVDFFTTDAANTDALKLFARAMHGRAEVLSIESISALVGSAIAPAEEGRVYNVDLLHTVIGLERDQIVANAVSVPIPGTSVILQVMHPLDVLVSRNANLHSLIEKQNQAGQFQFRLAIEVARKYLEEKIDAITMDNDLTVEERERAIFDELGIVSDYSTEDAAKKNAERYGIYLADAIPAWRMDSDVFWEKQWPHLRQRMSLDYVEQCVELAGRNPARMP